MKSLLLTFVALLFSQSAFSETAQFKIKGMHCGGCVDAIKAEVCEANDLGLLQCDVKVGEMNLSSLSNQKLDIDKIKTLVKKAGYEVASVKMNPVAPKPKK